MNRWGIDYTYPGICSGCHTEIAEFKVGKDGNFLLRKNLPIVERFKGNMRMISLILNDGSNMSVAICNKCEKDLDADKLQEINESEINGWQKEIDRELTDKWTDKARRAHMKTYSEKHILNRADKPIRGLTPKEPRANKLKVKK